MTSRKEQVLNIIKTSNRLVDATYISEQLGLDRSNVSRYLTELYKSGVVNRTDGRPVLYSMNKELALDEKLVSFDFLVGKDESLAVSIKQGKAAMLYPPRGLHTLIFGESGTGKSMFAECMYEFGLSSGSLEADAPFVSFNCADYAQNPQLLFGHIFGIKQGAFTGAEDDKLGLIAKADGGVLFLDEIHRLPPEGQEMLFTFIDKGTYRPLGENQETHHACVQIIGATTEKEELFLDTFKRRIPMFITLPSLKERTLEERYDIISLFLSQEASRLSTPIHIEREAILAFILYKTMGNIGQMKRDLKSVCAKAFLHYRTTDAKYLSIGVADLPLSVQKGLLHIREIPDQFNSLIENFSEDIIYYPEHQSLVWRQDVTQDMAVYNTIDDEVTSQSLEGNQTIDLEYLVKKNLNQYFDVYVDELSRSDIHQNLVEADIWELTTELYAIAEDKLKRQFDEKTRFTFALHLQSTIERIKKNQLITHPDLNDVRKKYLSEFQVAIELSNKIEQHFDIMIPFDEIGFMTMFLTTEVSDNLVSKQQKIDVMLLMHGRSTATSMIEAAQELLEVSDGVAFNMPLSMEPTQMYDQVKQYVIDNKEHLNNGLLILTDMGSLEKFSSMLMEETQVVTKTISFASTMIVLEAIRMASTGRLLNETHDHLQTIFESMVQKQFEMETDREDVLVATCFTGEGVAKLLNDKLQPLVNQQGIRVIQIQFLDRSSFTKRISELNAMFNIKAIIGTVDVEFPTIPFFKAYDILKGHYPSELQELFSPVISNKDLYQSLEGNLKHVTDISKLIQDIEQTINQINNELKYDLDQSVEVGLMLHVAFLVDSLLDDYPGKEFENLTIFKQKYSHEMTIIKDALSYIEACYSVDIKAPDIAYLTEIYVHNRVSNHD